MVPHRAALVRLLLDLPEDAPVMACCPDGRVLARAWYRCTNVDALVRALRVVGDHVTAELLAAELTKTRAMLDHCTPNLDRETHDGFLLHVARRVAAPPWRHVRHVEAFRLLRVAPRPRVRLNEARMLHIWLDGSDLRTTAEACLCDAAARAAMLGILLGQEPPWPIEVAMAETLDPARALRLAWHQCRFAHRLKTAVVALGDGIGELRAWWVGEWRWTMVDEYTPLVERALTDATRSLVPCPW